MSKKNIVVIGGGHGQAIILRGIKNIEDVHISAIVTVADDGGSTGRIRHYFNMPAMGDIRGVLLALAEEESLMTSLMDYRFVADVNGDGIEEDIIGHNLGNLILTALAKQTGSFSESVNILSKILKVKGDIIPSSSDLLTLFCITEDGTIVEGEENIPKYNNRIEKVFYQKKAKATPSAVKAIEEADLIIYGIGSLYTSILPNIIIEDISEALKRTKAKKVYFCNAMTQPGETDHYNLEDHVNALIKHGAPVDEVITHVEKLPEVIVDAYLHEGSTPVDIMQNKHDYVIEKKEILDFSKGLIRHDSNKIKEIVVEILGK